MPVGNRGNRNPVHRWSCISPRLFTAELTTRHTSYQIVCFLEKQFKCKKYQDKSINIWCKMSFLHHWPLYRWGDALCGNTSLTWSGGWFKPLPRPFISENGYLLCLYPLLKWFHFLCYFYTFLLHSDLHSSGLDHKHFCCLGWNRSSIYRKLDEERSNAEYFTVNGGEDPISASGLSCISKHLWEHLRHISMYTQAVNKTKNVNRG